MDLLRDGKVSHKELITHRFPPEQWKEALTVAIDKGKLQSIKTMFVRS
jgi:threonine dehydrogenase-like Zn-dependent dehydrogenase